MEEDFITQDDVRPTATDDSNISEGACLVNTDEVNVKLICEIGAVNLTIDELKELKVGSTVEFIKWPNKVKLRLNGTSFAEGYLVEVNGMLGVKISNRV